MMHGRLALMTALFAFITLLTACSTNTTTVTEVQSDDRAGRDFRNILVVAASSNREGRTVVGQALAKQLNSHGISATYLADNSNSLAWDDPAELRSQLLDVASLGQHDGILISSLVEARHHEKYQPETVSYIPGSRDIGPTGSMTYMERSVWPESFERSVEYVIKSTLYDGTTGEAVWEVVSSTVDPDTLEKGANSFASAIAQALDNSAGQEPKP